MLNMGCGQNILQCADNMDLEPTNNSKVIWADAEKQIPSQNKSIDMLIIVSPYGYKPLESDEVRRVLRKNGRLIIVGNMSNRFFKEIWNAKQKELLQIVGAL